MYKKRIFCLLLGLVSLSLSVLGKKVEDTILTNYKSLSSLPDSVLLQKGDAFMEDNRNDSALFYFTYLYNNSKYTEDTAYWRSAAKAMNKAFRIYFYNCDYAKAFESLTKALDICEKASYDAYIGNIYNNVGNLLFVCGEYDESERYFQLAYQYASDLFIKAAIFNNLGVTYCEKHQYGTALSFFQQAYELRLSGADTVLLDELNNLGYAYYELQVYDTALSYFNQALQKAQKMQRYEKTAKILTNKGRLYVALSDYEKAFQCYKHSDNIAWEYNYPDRRAENLWCYSEAYERMGVIDKALSFYKQYTDLKDSLAGNNKYGMAHQLSSVREMHRIEEQVRMMTEEQKIAAIKLRNKNVIQILVSVFLLLAVVFSIILYLKNKHLFAAYEELVAKNMEIVRFYTLYRKRPSKEKSKGSLTDEDKTTLLDTIEQFMEDATVFCDPDFSLERLSEAINSNSNYVSKIINEKTGKNFRVYINEYRIREACRLMANPENDKFSIETIASMVGFKSKSSFNIAFKNFTGVTPSFYLKSLKNNKDNRNQEA